MNVDLSERLKKFGKEMKDWEEKKTSIEGVSIIKMPSKNDDLNLGLKIIPISEEGRRLKRREKALFVTSIEQWEAFKEVFNNEKGLDLIESIDKIKTPRKVTEKEEEEEVFEL